MKSGKKKHKGLDLLRLALGGAMPEKSRKGALMPKYLAPLAGINYETVRQLLNGARDFESDTPLNQLMAENLAFSTGVHPGFRKTQESFIRDIWNEPYTPESYLMWKKRGLIAERIHTLPVPGKGRAKLQHPPFADEFESQSKNLLATILRVAKAKGPQYECMAFRLLKHALVGVSKDLGLIKEVEDPANDLKDFMLLVGIAETPQGTKLPTYLREAPWRPAAPALSIEGIDMGEIP